MGLVKENQVLPVGFLRPVREALAMPLPHNPPPLPHNPRSDPHPYNYLCLDSSPQ